MDEHVVFCCVVVRYVRYNAVGKGTVERGVSARVYGDDDDDGDDEDDDDGDGDDDCDDD